MKAGVMGNTLQLYMEEGEQWGKGTSGPWIAFLGNAELARRLAATVNFECAVVPHEVTSEPNFERALESLVNRYSQENQSNTSDFILAHASSTSPKLGRASRPYHMVRTETGRSFAF